MEGNLRQRPFPLIFRPPHRLLFPEGQTGSRARTPYRPHTVAGMVDRS